MIPNYREWMKQLIANAQEKKYEYLIARMKNNRNYFYYDLDWIGISARNVDIATSPYQLIWTLWQKKAYPFSSEQEVEEFKADFVSPRKASIIRVIKPPIDLTEMIG